MARVLPITPALPSIEAPVGTITPKIRNTLVRFKPALLAILNDLEEPETCEHVADDLELAEWYRENPHLTCGRCFFAGRPLRAMLQ